MQDVPEWVLSAEALTQPLPETLEPLTDSQLAALLENLELTLKPHRGKKRGFTCMEVRLDLVPAALTWLEENTTGFKFSRYGTPSWTHQTMQITWGDW